jgi:hypothetical protein
MDRVIGRIEPAYSILKCWTQLLSLLMIAHGYIVPTVALGEPYLYARGDGIRVLQPYCNRVRMGWYLAGNPLDVIVGFLLVYAIIPDRIERGRI